MHKKINLQYFGYVVFNKNNKINKSWTNYIMEVKRLLIEIIKFIIYSTTIVIISKYILVKTIRKLADNLNIKAKTTGNIAGLATSVPELLTITTSSLKGLYRC